MEVLQDLRSRGVTQMDLLVTDGHDGWLTALAALFTAAPRQRGVVQKQRNARKAIPKRAQHAIATAPAGIWTSPTREEALTQLAAFKGPYGQLSPEAVRSLMEDEEHLLTLYAFPPVMHRSIRTTTAMESFFRNVRQRTDPIDTWTTETRCLTTVGRHARASGSQNSRELTAEFRS